MLNIKNMNYTSEELLAHGELILEYEKSGKTLGIQYYSKVLKMWENIEAPCFYPHYEYRKAPQPHYTNSLGENFNVGDKVWYWDFEDLMLYTMKIDKRHTRTDLGCSDGETEACKTKSGALLLASKHYEK